MLEVLRDPAWQFVGVVFALIAIIVSVRFARPQGKRLTFDVLASLPLLTISEERIEGLRLTYKGKTLDEARLVLMRVQNSGYSPILAEDVEVPLRIGFSNGARILASTITETIPAGLTHQITHQDNVITLSPALLNRGDALICRALVCGTAGSPIATARIAGVENIESRLESLKRGEWFLPAGGVTVILSMFLARFGSLALIGVASGIAMFFFGSWAQTRRDRELTKYRRSLIGRSGA